MLSMLALIFLLPVPSNGSKAQSEAADAFIVENVRLFDGVRFYETSNVFVKDGFIFAVGESLDVPEEIKRIDGVGLTMLPGLIDAHTHTFGNALSDNLRFGVSVNLDMFMSADLMRETQINRDQAGPSTEADLFSAGTLATVESGHGTQFGLPIETLHAPDQAAGWVARRKEEGSDYIKLVYISGQTRIPSLDLATARAIIEAAHAERLMALAHISTQAGAMDMVEAGIDGLVHVFTDEVVSEDFIERANENDVFIIPTLTVLSGISQEGGNAALAEDIRLAPYLEARQAEGLARSFGEGIAGVDLSIALENVAKLHAAGVTILAGSDAPNPGTTHGASLHHEIELLARAGLSNRDALEAASSLSAQRFNLDGRGRLVAGVRADFSLIEGDPREDITVTRNIMAVYKNGYEVERAVKLKQMDAADLPANLGQFGGGLDAPAGLIWTGTDDAVVGGKSTARIKAHEEGYLDIEAHIADGFAFPWAGAFLAFETEDAAPASMAGYKRLTFQAKGTPGIYRVMLFDTSIGGIPPSQSFEISEDWKEISLELGGFAGFSAEAFTGLAIVAGPGRGEFHFQLDDVTLEE